MIAVLWLVAAMSILVLGATNTVRQHIQATGQLRDVVSSQAVAEAAFALALQQLMAENKREPGIQSGQFQVMGMDVPVQVVPLNGWINLNGADETLLARVFTVAGGLPAPQAAALAKDVKEWRDKRPEGDPDGLRNSGQNKRLFERVDDLMLVPGVDYDLFARVRGLFVTDLSDGAKVNVLAAPPDVLAVVADGNQGVVDQITRNRSAGMTEVDTSALERNLVQTTPTDHYRLSADIPMDAGKMLRVTQDVVVGRSYSKIAPWRVLRETRQVQAAGS